MASWSRVVAAVACLLARNTWNMISTSSNIMLKAVTPATQAYFSSWGSFSSPLTAGSKLTAASCFAQRATQPLSISNYGAAAARPV